MIPWREAWQAALYDDSGFFRTQRPGQHFRTSTHAGDVFAQAIRTLAGRSNATSVTDVGAGGGELLAALHLLDPSLHLVGVDIATRPEGLDPAIEWRDTLPDRVDGLLVANEWLDNIPCEVVEVDDNGVIREVLVELNGEEALGDPVTSPWINSWWPMTEPGHRAEVGLARDDAWADAVSRVSGLAVAIDYGHTSVDRPPYGSLNSYAHGREVDVIPDGSRDLTAHVAVDAVAAATGASLFRQRDALRLLGIDGGRPPHDLAHSDPAAYMRALSVAADSGELLTTGGLGDFWWIITDTLGRETLGA